MRKSCVLVLVAVCALALAGCRLAEEPVSPTSEQPTNVTGCTTIQEGVLMYSAGHYLAGQPLMVGFDPFGYNYEGHMFRGSYANSYLGGDGFPPYEGDDDAYLADNPAAASTWYWPYRGIHLSMKWSDAWLSDTDCDGDGSLDRHYGFPGYIDSGAWLTNHMRGGYTQDWKNNKMRSCKWTYFVKIVAAPGDATLASGVWYNADGVEIGLKIWGSFATIQQIDNDACAGYAGVSYKSPAGPGFGKY